MPVPGGHSHVAARGERLGHRLGHLELTGAHLSGGKGRHDPSQQLPDTSVRSHADATRRLLARLRQPAQDFARASKDAAAEKGDDDQRQHDDGDPTMAVQREGGTDEDEGPDEQLGGVPDQEVPPELAERTQRPDDRRSSNRTHVRPLPPGERARSFASRTRGRPAVAAKTPTSTRTMRSLPGQCSPDPSPTQKTPKLVNMMPTANFMAFSGTSESWRATRYPTPPTTTAAAAAATAARPR